MIVVRARVRAQGVWDGWGRGGGKKERGGGCESTGPPRPRPSHTTQFPLPTTTKKTTLNTTTMASLQKIVARPGASAPRAARGALKVNAIKAQTPYRDELIATVRFGIEAARRESERAAGGARRSVPRPWHACPRRPTRSLATPWPPLPSTLPALACPGRARRWRGGRAGCAEGGGGDEHTRSRHVALASHRTRAPPFSKKKTQKHS